MGGNAMRSIGAVTTCAAALGIAFALLGCSSRPPSGTYQPIGEARLENFRVSGPYTHANLHVFLIHSESQEDGEFLTLDEGLKKGLVVITEKEQSTVSELVIENQSDLPLFLQEGDRLYGGKQDRIIYASIIIPPKSGKMTVPAFCIEPGRWSPDRHGMRFVATDNSALAPRAVRNAAKLAKDQGAVWNNVRRIQVAFQNSYNTRTTTSSLNEVQEHPEVAKACEEYTAALSKVLDDKTDVVGVAIAVGGRLEEVNVYPNYRLLKRMYPRLIQSYVPQAAFQQRKDQSAEPPTCEDVVKLLTQGKPRSTRSETINADNRLEVVTLEFAGQGDQFAKCTTSFRDKTIHLQHLRIDPQELKHDRSFDNDIRQQRPIDNDF